MVAGFVAALPNANLRSSSATFVTPTPSNPRRYIRRPLRSRRASCMVTEPQTETRAPEFSGMKDAEPQADASLDPNSGMSGLNIDPEVVKQKAQEIASDVSSRPGFYVKVLSYIGFGFVSITVLNAIVTAIDALPLLPDILELVGLAYTAWFVWRYVLFSESRAELMEEVEEFIGRSKPKSQNFTDVSNIKSES